MNTSTRRVQPRLIHLLNSACDMAENMRSVQCYFVLIYCVLNSEPTFSHPVSNKFFFWFSFQIHGFGTVAAVLMPALLPGCATLYEVGAYTMDGDNIDNLLVDSPDGLIKIDHMRSPNANCCELEIFSFNSDNITLELKSPFPDAEKIPVHYKVPKYYILQILIHMAATESESNWYGCCGTKSLVAIDCKFDEQLWGHLWDRIKTFLHKEKPVASQWINDIVIEFKDEFNTYIEEKTELIGEVPLVYMAEDASRFMICATQFSPYHKPAAMVCNRSGPDLNDVRDIINLVYLRAGKVIRSAYQIFRQEASEIIAFVASDSNRLPHPGLP